MPIEFTRYLKEHQEYMREHASSKKNEMFYCCDWDHAVVQYIELFRNTDKSIHMVIDKDALEKLAEEPMFMEEYQDATARGVEIKILIADEGKETREKRIKLHDGLVALIPEELYPKTLSEFSIFKEKFPDIDMERFIKEKYTNEQIEEMIPEKFPDSMHNKIIFINNFSHKASLNL